MTGLFMGAGLYRDKHMQLIRTDDFETVKHKYIEVIENTPGIEQYARWVYGKHPTDESLKALVDRGEMYLLMDGEEVAGMAAIVMCQGEDYNGVSWQENLEHDQVATIHLLAVCPSYRGRSLSIRILEEAADIAAGNEKKALRLDVLKPNVPARIMYERAGFSYRGEQALYAENTGILEFVFYEKRI